MAARRAFARAVVISGIYTPVQVETILQAI
jgi:hypothetical protein